MTMSKGRCSCSICAMMLRLIRRSRGRKGATMSKGRRTRIEKIRGVVEHRQHGQVDKCRIDLMTAQALVCVWDGLSPESRARFETIPMPRLIDFAWKHVRLVQP